MIEATTSSVLDGLSGQPVNPSASNDADGLGMATFLQLMTTQLRNQDPSSPQDSSEFLSQLAQFSSLTGIQSIDRSINSAVAGLTADRLLQASAMVGRQVLSQTDILSTQQSPSALTGQVELRANTANLRVNIQNESGQTVRTLTLGAQSSGTREFAWDGLDENGNALPAGDYRLVADVPEAIDLQPQVYLRDQVTSVTVDSSGELYLNLSQLPTISLARVIEVS